MPILQTKHSDPAWGLKKKSQENASSAGQGFGLFSENFGGQNPFLNALSSSFAPGIQTKLEVGSANDPSEQEADRVAEQVVQNAESDRPVLAPIHTSAAMVRRQPSEREIARAELFCDLRSLCRMRFSDPSVVTPERVRRAYATCRPGFFPPIDPCLMPDPLIHPSTPGTGSSSAPEAEPVRAVAAHPVVALLPGEACST